MTAADPHMREAVVSLIRSSCQYVESDCGVPVLAVMHRTTSEIADALLSPEGPIGQKLAAAEAHIRELEAGLVAVTANLAGAASAYRKHASRHRSVGRAVSDPFFRTRADDFDQAVESARALLSPPASTPNHPSASGALNMER